MKSSLVVWLVLILTGCTAGLPSLPHTALSVNGFKAENDTVILQATTYSVRSWSAREGPDDVFNPRSFVTTYQVPEGEGQLVAGETRELSAAVAAGRVQFPERQETKSRRSLSPSELATRPRQLRWFGNDKCSVHRVEPPRGEIPKLGLFGNEWKGFRDLLEVKANEGYAVWQPSDAATKFFASAADGRVGVADLQSGTFAFDAALSAMLGAARSEAWFVDADYFFTERGNYLVVLPSTFPRIYGAAPEPPIMIGGQSYPRGEFGLFVSRSSNLVEVFPLHHGGLRLACFAESKTGLELLYAEFAASADHAGSGVHLTVTDVSGNELASFGSQTTSPGEPNSPERNILCWDADNKSLWYWIRPPKYYSSDVLPQFDRVPRELRCLRWNYGKDGLSEVTLLLEEGAKK